MLQIRVGGLDRAFLQAMSVSSRESVVRNAVPFPSNVAPGEAATSEQKGRKPRHEGHPDVSALNELSMRAQADV
jgi:hypothetical protein